MALWLTLNKLGSREELISSHPSRQITLPHGAKLVRVSPELFKRGLELYRRHRDKEWQPTDRLSFQPCGNFILREALTGDTSF